jgi:hypothetical protein
MRSRCKSRHVGVVADVVAGHPERSGSESTILLTYCRVRLLMEESMSLAKESWARTWTTYRFGLIQQWIGRSADLA